MTPEDIEQRQGTWGGHGFHGDLALDQWFAMRPSVRDARVRDADTRVIPVRRRALIPAGFSPERPAASRPSEC